MAFRGTLFAQTTQWTLTDLESHRETRQAGVAKYESDRPRLWASLAKLENEYRDARASLKKADEDFRANLQALQESQDLQTGIVDWLPKLSGAKREYWLRTLLKTRESHRSLLSSINLEARLVSGLHEEIEMEQRLISKHCQAIKDNEELIGQSRRWLKECEELMSGHLSLSASSTSQFRTMLAMFDHSTAPAEVKMAILESLRDRLKTRADALIDQYLPGGDNRPAKEIVHAIIDLNPAKAVIATAGSPSQINPASGTPPATAPPAISGPRGGGKDSLGLPDRPQQGGDSRGGPTAKEALDKAGRTT